MAAGASAGYVVTTLRSVTLSLRVDVHFQYHDSVNVLILAKAKNSQRYLKF
jgi:hypothetical protein